MKHISKILLFAIPLIVTGVLTLGVFNNNVEASGTTQTVIEDGTPNPLFYNNDEYINDEDFPRAYHYLLPPPVPILSDPNRDYATERVAYGAVDETEELPQPIAYSHKLHAGELKIECQYCHTYAKRSIHAGIPSTQICMNCHGKAPNGAIRVDPTGRPELYKLLAYNYGAEEVARDFASSEDPEEEIAEIVDGIERQEIPWLKVHDLPDFVYFTHKRHVKAGIACQECHGEVQDDMTVGRRVSELTMGWCLNCHETHPSIQENYCSESELDQHGSCEMAELRRVEIKDCYTCHK